MVRLAAALPLSAPSALDKTVHLDKVVVSLCCSLTHATRLEQHERPQAPAVSCDGAWTQKSLRDVTNASPFFAAAAAAAPLSL